MCAAHQNHMRMGVPTSIQQSPPVVCQKEKQGDVEAGPSLSDQQLAVSFFVRTITVDFKKLNTPDCCANCRSLALVWSTHTLKTNRVNMRIRGLTSADGEVLDFDLMETITQEDERVYLIPCSV